MNGYFSNKKYGLFYMPIVFMAIFYLIAAADLGYVFNAPMKMHPGGVNPASVSNSVNLNYSGNAGISENLSNSVNNHNFKNISGVICLECQNIPAAYGNKISVIYKLFTFVPFIKSLHRHNFVRSISHPPKSIFS
jgi:hypothetical protein